MVRDKFYAGRTEFPANFSFEELVIVSRAIIRSFAKGVNF